MNNDIYPLTIVKDRYGGAYSEGQYLAFNLYPGSIPDAVGGGDMEEDAFWRENGEHTKFLIGKGYTPDSALLDLAQKIEANGKSSSITLYKQLFVVPYQTCPLCNGYGEILQDGFTSSVYKTCSICNGGKIIPMHIVD